MEPVGKPLSDALRGAGRRSGWPRRSLRQQDGPAPCVQFAARGDGVMVTGHLKAHPGKLMLTVLGGIAEFEREIMLERQREGIAKAKAEGKYKGRKPTAMAKAEEVKKLHGEGVGATEIAQRLGIGRASVYRVLAG